MRIRLLLVDDHRIIREGIASLLSNSHDMEIVGSFSSGEELVNSFRPFSANVILMDILMSGMNGLEATRWIKEQDPKMKVIIISSEIKKEFVSTGIKCGIDGYLPKDVDKDTLIEAIRKVSLGEKFFNQAIMNLVFEDFYQGEKTGKKQVRKVIDGLTKREYEVMGLTASGKTNKEIADSLFISIKTVETHKTNILEKLGLKNTAELVLYAIKNKIISID